MAEQQKQSIIDVLPEDILVILLSRHGLHPSLGSTCQYMRKLSLSEKCIGSVCVTIKKENKHADPRFLPYKHTYSLFIERELNDYEQYTHYFLGDHTWPYLTIVVSGWLCFVHYMFKIVQQFPTIYAPRLIELDMPFLKNINLHIMKTHQRIKERMPLVAFNIDCSIDSKDILSFILHESQNGLKIKNCYFNTSYDYEFNFDNDMKDIILQYKPEKFIENTEIGCFLFPYVDNRLLDYMSKITQRCIKITTSPLVHAPGEFVYIDLIISKIKMLYDICYTHTNHTKEYIIIEYNLRFHTNVDYIKLYKYLQNTYPKITLSQIRDDSDDDFYSYDVVFKYPRA